MKYIRLAFPIFALFFALPELANAARVSPGQVSNLVEAALSAASSSVTNGSGKLGAPSTGTRAPRVARVEPLLRKGRAIAHAVTLQGNGYIIMAADDDLPPWKLFSEDGSPSNIPPDLLNVVLDELHEDLLVAEESRLHTNAAPSKFAKRWRSTKILPTTGTPEVLAAGTQLLSTTWDQGNPYNYYCPTAVGGPGGRAYAGCTACALAQILRYHGQPSAPSTGHTYSDTKGTCTGTRSMADVGLGAYDWANMPTSISTGSAAVQQQAVGKLMYHAAVSLDSDFEKSGTGANPRSIPNSLRTYFAYTCSDYSDRAAYSTASWYNRIAQNIDAGKPVFYSMWQADYSAGHAVVCDGYRNGSEIHLNLGWSGSYSAWYNLDSVSAAGYTWTIHGAVFDITPSAGNAPANDSCSGAFQLLSGVTSVVDTTYATSTGDPTPACGNAPGKGVWFKCTPSAAGNVIVSTCGSSFDTVIGVYQGTCGALSAIACDDDSGCANHMSQVTFSGQAGVTYYILVAGYTSAAGLASVSVRLPSVVTPANDQCSGATTVGNGASVSMNTGAATSSGDPTPSCGSGFGKGVWYKITPSSSGQLVVQTCGSSYDTVLALFTGSCGSLTQVACNDDDSSCNVGGSSASRVSVSAVAGRTYYILIGGYNGESGTLQLSVQLTSNPAPVNDSCSGALVLVSGVTNEVETSAATSTSDPTPSCGSGFGKGVWYKFSTDMSSTVTVTTCGSSFDTVIAVYSGSCAGLVPVGCNDDGGCGNNSSAITLATQAGVTYYVLAGGYAGAYGTLRISASLPRNGAAAVMITPQGAINSGAKWRIDSGPWLSSGTTMSPLTPGNHVLSFFPAVGYVTPENRNLTIGSGVTSALTVAYSTDTARGSLQVIAGPSSDVGAWQVDGGVLRTNRATAIDLTVGVHSVSFVSVAGWLTPPPILATVRSGKTVRISGYYARTNEVKFLDTCDGGSLDGDRWSSSGYNVTESGGLIAVTTDVTDQPGTLSSQPVLISTTSPLTFSRRAYIHHDDSIYYQGQNHFFDGKLTFNLSGVPTFSVFYEDYDYGSMPRHGFFVTRNGASTHDPLALGDVSAAVSPVWDSWFDEKIVYAPTTGQLDYYIDGVKKVTMNVGSIASNSSGLATLSFTVQAYGWWTGHFQLMDDISILQDGTPRSRLRSIPLDFDGDLRSDYGCYYPPTGDWFLMQSTTGFVRRSFGYDGTTPVTGDFDADGMTDYGCYYPVGGNWYLMQSAGGFATRLFGYIGTIPVTGDFDGDGRTDYGCYHPDSGSWYFMQSAGGFMTKKFGFSGTVPVVGDFDGDGRTDYGCYYPPAGAWYLMQSFAGFTVRSFGYTGTVPVTGDFDGDGKTDIGCYYPPNGSWYIMASQRGFTTTQFGFDGTQPVTGDFDGDGRDDYGCYFAPGGNWYLMQSRDGFRTETFGFSGTIALSSSLSLPVQSAIPANVIGTWSGGLNESQQAFRITFSSGGSCTLYDWTGASFRGTYSVSGNVVTVSSSGNKNTGSLSIVLNVNGQDMTGTYVDKRGSFSIGLAAQ